MCSNIFFGENVDDDTRERIVSKQFKTILDGRSDIEMWESLELMRRMLINNGSKSVNQDLNFHTQEWYTLDALQSRKVLLTSSHVQHIISGERPWVITLSRGIRNFPAVVKKRESFLLT